MVVNILGQVGKAVSSHIYRNAGKYVAVAGAAVAGYLKGKIDGYLEGKKEGTCEQAKRDQQKMNEMKNDHDQERKEWKKQEKSYEELLNDVERNFKN